MNDRQAGAETQIDRRRFLHMSTSVVGSAAFGAVLAACGAPAAQAPAEPQKAETTSASALRSYLVIARYNREKWKSLSASERKQAEAAAEELFPEQATPLASTQGLQLARTLHTSIHTKIPYNFRALSDQQRDEMVETIFDDFNAQPASPPDADAHDPGVGWIAMIDRDRFAAFVEQMGGKHGPLWRMYDIEVIPLNDDRTTNDVYELMTPVHWN